MRTSEDIVKMGKVTERILGQLKALGSEYTVSDISHELWREYEHGGCTYRIDNPLVLVSRKGGTTHRVVDCYNVTHCHPIPGNGCALRWFNGTNNNPVNF